MRAASATPFRESFDFTPKGNRAERVQTVNGPYRSRLFGLDWRYLNVLARLTMSSIFMRPSVTETVRSVSTSAGRSGSSSMSSAVLAARKISSAAFARERVAAVRSAENAIPHERLQDRFEMAELAGNGGAARAPWPIPAERSH